MQAVCSTLPSPTILHCDDTWKAVTLNMWHRGGSGKSTELVVTSFCIGLTSLGFSFPISKSRSTTRLSQRSLPALNNERQILAFSDITINRLWPRVRAAAFAL